MKQITLTLSDAQFSQLDQVAKLVNEKPEDIAASELFSGFQAWGGEGFNFMESFDCSPRATVSSESFREFKDGIKKYIAADSQSVEVASPLPTKRSPGASQQVC